MRRRVQLRARRNQFFTYSGRSLLVTDLDGLCTGGGTEGFYSDNTRVLSRYQPLVRGQPLKPIVASPVGGDRFLLYAEVPPIESVPPETAYVESLRLIGDGMRDELRVRNHGRRPVRFELELAVAADFCDAEEAERGERQQRADVETRWDERRREVLFQYMHPELDRAVAVRVDSAPGQAAFRDGMLLFALQVPPQARAEIDLTVEPVLDGERRAAPRKAGGIPTGRLAAVRDGLERAAPRLVTTNSTVARAWETAVADLATLPLGLPSGPAAPMAGLPLYQQFFGRDTLTTAWQAAMALPEMLRDSLLTNAAWEGRKVDDFRDEEPGKLIHQVRWGPLSVLGLDPFARYYGDYATAPDFLIMLGQYLLWTNDVTTVRGLLPTARRVIEWLDRYGDRDGDGFIEYETRSPKGVKNQGWKDSDDAIVDERGDVVESPIATSELQAYWYAGLQHAAIVFALCGDRGYAVRLLREAHRLRRAFNEAFWMVDRRFYALALGPDKRPIRSIASNAGHLLATGIVPRERARSVASRLMEPDMFSGWGIRTLSSSHGAYNPFSYHRGSVWPVENGTFAIGLGRYGLFEELHRLAGALFDATELFVENRLPEAIAGIERDEWHPHPGIYPTSNEPQSWSASMIVLLVQALLGLRPFAPLGLLLVDPHLPAWLPNIRLEAVRVGTGQVDLQAWRSGTRTRYRVLRTQGGVRVLTQPPPNSPQATVGGRAVTAVVSLLPWPIRPPTR